LPRRICLDRSQSSCSIYYYRNRYYRRKAWKAEREQEKLTRKQAKKWRKHREKEWRKYHGHYWRRYHGPRRHSGHPPPFPPHFW
jgi:hypothetical protein